MRLRAEQLAAHLGRGPAAAFRVFLVHGDEPLLVLEAAEAIRAAARTRGHAEREVLLVERGFDWSAFRQAAGTRSLFGERRLLELRFATGRPTAAAAAAIAEYCREPDPEQVLLATMPRPEGAGWWKSPWFAAFDRAGAVVEVQPVARAQLPQWIGERLARQGQRADPETLAFLADRVEGNLLAAQQEILKLALLAPQGELDPAQVARAVSSVARYDFPDLAESLYAGDAAHYLRVLEGLRGEGESAAGLAWRLGEELCALLQIRTRMAAGRPLEQLFAEHRIFRNAQPRCERALKRFSAAQLRALVLGIARIERASKGVGPGDPWQALAALGLEWPHGIDSPGRADAA